MLTVSTFQVTKSFESTRAMLLGLVDYYDSLVLGGWDVTQLTVQAHGATWAEATISHRAQREETEEDIASRLLYEVTQKELRRAKYEELRKEFEQ